MSNDMGGPAFPTENERQTGPNDYRYEGMTLWDYFAAHALAGLLANGERDGVGPPEEQHASSASLIADAMLEERRKRKEQG